MLLSKDFLKDVLYYEYKFTSPMLGFGFISVFKLHFKQWWKPAKTLKMRWSYIGDSGEHSRWQESESAVQLKRQLEEYFK